jgi:hypothetical protein
MENASFGSYCRFTSLSRAWLFPQNACCQLLSNQSLSVR